MKKKHLFKSATAWALVASMTLAPAVSASAADNSTETQTTEATTTTVEKTSNSEASTQSQTEATTETQATEATTTTVEKTSTEASTQSQTEATTEIQATEASSEVKTTQEENAKETTSSVAESTTEATSEVKTEEETTAQSLPTVTTSTVEAPEAVKAVDVSQMKNNSWNKIDGKYYYVKDNELVTNRVINIDGKYYGFDSDGVMYDNTLFSSVIVFEDGTSDIGSFRAKSGGVLYENEWYKDSDGNYYYYMEYGRSAYGPITVDGVLYYFKSGSICKNEVNQYKSGDKYYYSNAQGKTVELKNNGWNNCGGKYYYIKDNKMLTSCVENIDGKYYGFDSSGVMYDNEEFYIVGYLKWIYYRAKKGGALYQNEWYKNEYGRYYYYGDDAQPVSGFVTINGVNYYFYSDGSMYSSTSFTVDGKNYYADTNGKVTELKNGWNKINGKYFYVKDNRVCSSCVEKIGDKYYGFGYSGAMYEDTSFSINTYDSESNSGVDKYYRAKKDGSLYVNEWYKTLGNRDEYYYYYYGEDGVAPSGIATVDNTTYYFYYNGQLAKNTTVVENSVNYVVNENGVAKELKNNAWTKIDGKYYYVKDGEILKNTIEKIGNNYYYFNNAGQMLDDDTILFSQDNDGTISSYYIRAKKDGALYHNEWYKDEYGRYYYYDSSSYRVDSQLKQIGKTTYYFNSTGDMAVKQVVKDTSSDTTVSYYADKDGVLSKIDNGWFKNPSNDEWMYFENGNYIINTVKDIGKRKFAFDYSGYLITDKVQSIGHYDENNNYYYDYYICTADGSIVTASGWQTYNGNYYYVTNDGSGKLVIGNTTINGREYKFNPAMVYSQGYVVVNDKLYSANNDGILTQITQAGMYTLQYGDTVCVSSDGTLLKKGWKHQGSNWYYFDSNGELVENQRYAIGDKAYYFDAEGKMVTNGWIGKEYYADSNGVLAEGEYKINGNYYYFGSNNVMKTGYVSYNGKNYVYGADGKYVGEVNKNGWNLINGNYYYVKDKRVYTSQIITDAKNNMYMVDGNGKMLKSTITSNFYVANGFSGKRLIDKDGVLAKGWTKFDGAWYYADPKTGVLKSDGMVAIDGKQYYFDSDSKMAYNYDYKVGNIVYHFGKDGVLESTTEDALKDGWTYIDGNAYYYKNGKPYTGWVGDYYVSGGHMQVNSICTINDKTYYLGTDGKYVKNSWIENGSTYRYAKADGTLAKDEFLTLGSSKYYFDGINMVTGLYTIDGTQYLFDEDGRLVKKFTNVNNGWVKQGDSYYYGHLGTLVSSKILTLNNKTYAIDDDGVMVANKLYSRFYYDADGVRANYTGWKQIDGKWYYFNKMNESVYGWLKLGSNTYYLSSTGMYTGYHVINNKLYRFDDNGVLKEVCNQKSGWKQIDNNDWCYFENGELVTSGTKIINNKLYAFAVGKMVRNQTYNSNGCVNYYDNDGLVVTTKGWKKIQINNKYDSKTGEYSKKDAWIYIGNNGKLYSGVKKIGDKIYYFNYSGIMQ